MIFLSKPEQPGNVTADDSTYERYQRCRAAFAHALSQPEPDRITRIFTEASQYYDTEFKHSKETCQIIDRRLHTAFSLINYRTDKTPEEERSSFDLQIAIIQRNPIACRFFNTMLEKSETYADRHMFRKKSFVEQLMLWRD